MPPRTKQREKKRSRECVESKRYPMYMMSAAKFLELYESGTKLLEHHQLLKSRGDLKLFEVSPLEDHSEQGVRNFRSGIRQYDFTHTYYTHRFSFSYLTSGHLIFIRIRVDITHVSCVEPYVK